MKLLILEDDPISLRLMELIFDRYLRSELPFEVELHEACYGHDAIEMARRCDAVIIDQGLPDMSGLEVAEKIRAECPGYPIMFRTMCPDHELIEQMSVYGPVITKGTEQPTLKAIEDFLKQAHEATA